MIARVGDEIPVPLELVAGLAGCRNERGLDVCPGGLPGPWIKIVEIIPFGRLLKRHVVFEDRVRCGAGRAGRPTAARDSVIRLHCAPRLRHDEQPIVQTHFRRLRAACGKPVNVALHLASFGARGAAPRVRIVRAVHGDDVAFGVTLGAQAFDDVAVAQSNFRAG